MEQRRKLTRSQVEKIVRKAREGGEKADLREIDFSNLDLREVYLKETDLREADLSWTNLSWADLRGANLAEANLYQANLYQANLTRANLSGTKLYEVNLSKTNLSNANLKEAHLRQATFREARLKQTNLTQASLSGTILAGVDLSTVKGLETIKHRGPSYIDVATLQNSKGRIPEIFLRGAGVPEALITYLPSILGQAIQYYSCFISYSSKDQTFAERLHNDLQAKGVRCWFAPHDMRIGAKIRPAIDESIRIHDKLLLILSEHSMASQWVEHEVEHGLDLEIQRGQLVLFPIRLDNTIMNANTGWTGNIKRGRHIGDFTHWTDPAAYQKAFERLLHDLSPETMPPLPVHIQVQADQREARQELEALRRQLAQHQRNRDKLREQAAVYAAGEKPLRLLNQIEAEEKEIEALQRRISELSQD